ncbi:MAG: cytochrome P450 [Chloroflexota bacterium]|nr:cytochrome P450 [Chloroflexota bacterium]
MRYPPGPRYRIRTSTLLYYRRDPLGMFTRLAREHGDIASVRLASYDLVLLSHPQHIRDALVTNSRIFQKGPALKNTKIVLGEGLLTSEGEYHLRQRRLAQPAFHRQRVAAYGEVMAAHAARMRAAWREGITLDISREMSRLTLGVVAETLFGSHMEREADQVRKALTSAMGWFDLLLVPYAHMLLRLPLPASRRFHRAHAHLDRVIYGLIEDARRREDRDCSDLLTMLLHSQEEGVGMTDAQLRDEALTIFLAGHETVANALTWTWYLLSQHPEVEMALHDELDTVLGGRLPTSSDVPSLPYTRMVLSESMRLYPPAWGVGRRAMEEYEVGGYRLPAGTVVVMSQWVTHRDPRWYPEPEKFDPARWTPEEEARRPRYSYFPFGGGPRQCIGEGFAWMEGVLLLATLAQQWKLRLAPAHKVETQPLITLRPKYGMRMTLERRV